MGQCVDVLDCLFGGEHAREVEHRLHDDDVTPPGGCRGFPGHDLRPRNAIRLATLERADRFGSSLEHRAKLVAFELAVAHRGRAAGHQHGEPTERAILGKAGKIRLNAREPIGKLLEILGVGVEQCVALEEVSAGVEDVPEVVGVGLHALGERAGRGGGFFRGRRVDDDDDVLVEQWEGPLVVELENAMRQLVRDHRRHVGVHPEVARGVESEQRGDDGDEPEDEGKAARRGADDPRGGGADPLVEVAQHLNISGSASRPSLAGLPRQTAKRLIALALERHPRESRQISA